MTRSSILTIPRKRFKTLSRTKSRATENCFLSTSSDLRHSYVLRERVFFNSPLFLRTDQDHRPAERRSILDVSMLTDEEQVTIHPTLFWKELHKTYQSSWTESDANWIASMQSACLIGKALGHLARFRNKFVGDETKQTMWRQYRSQLNDGLSFLTNRRFFQCSVSGWTFLFAPSISFLTERREKFASLTDCSGNRNFIVVTEREQGTRRCRGKCV